MLTFRVWSFFLILMSLSLNARAISGEELMVFSYCKNPKTCGTTNTNLFALFKVKCESDQLANNCDQLAKENPAWAPLMRKCDTASLCDQNEEFMKNKNLACLRGYKNAAVDLGLAVKDLGVMLGTFIGESAAKTVISIEKRNQEIKEADKDITKKRKIVEGDPRYNRLSDEELKKLPAAFLFVQATEYNAITSSQKRMAHKDLSSRVAEPERFDPTNENQRDVVLEKIKKTLEKEYDRYACYNPLAQEELKCYALGSVIDPLTIAGYFAKAGRVASAVSKGIESEKNLSRTRDLGKAIEEKRTYTGATQVMIAKPTAAKVAAPASVGTVPDVLKIDQVTQVDGSHYLRYSYGEKLPDGRWVRNQKELPLDDLTGAINANFSTGREFFEKMVQAKAGKSHLAFIDVGSLGAVNKEFQAGTVAGDRYIKAVADEIMKHGEGKITLARLGGDEFGILIDSANPQEVQKILRNIQDGLRKDLAGPAHQVFRDEKIVRAEKYREEAKALAAQRPDGALTAADKQALRKDIDELAKIQQPDISIGTTQVGHQDDLSHLLEKAEGQAKAMKVDTVLNFGRSAEKYGSDAAPRAKPNPRYQGAVQKPLDSDSWTSKAASSELVDLDKMSSMKIRRQEEVSRFGSTTLARYQDELGRDSYRVEKYFTDKMGIKQRISSEIPTRGHTGLLDGLHPESQNLVMGHLKSSGDTTLMMTKLRSLRYLNYFESGTKAGDDILEAVAKAIKKNTRNEDLTFKLGGADFLVSLKDTDAAGVARISNKIRDEVKKSPEVKAVLDREKAALNEKLIAAQKKGDQATSQRLQKKMEDLKNFDLGLEFEAVGSKNLPSGASFKEVVDTLDSRFKR